MKDVSDAEFFDDELEAQVKAAFDGIAPSDDAQERMLANLLAYEAQVQGLTARGDVPSESGEAEVSAKAEVALEPEAEAIETKDATESVAKIVEMPKTKRRVRPWHVLVPVAAVLAVVGVVVALSPQMNFSALFAPERAAVEAVPEDTAVEAVAEGAAVEATPENADVEAVVQQDVLDAASNTGVEQSWARDFYTIELEDGTVLEIDSHASPVAVDASMAGNLLEEAIAINEAADASIACNVYASRIDKEGYLVSFLGSNAYFSAHEKADTV